MGEFYLDCGLPTMRTMQTEQIQLPGVGVVPFSRSSGRPRRLSDMASAGCLGDSSPLVSSDIYTTNIIFPKCKTLHNCTKFTIAVKALKLFTLFFQNRQCIVTLTCV